MYVIQGYTGQAVDVVEPVTRFARGSPPRSIVSSRAARRRPCIVVYVDAWTAYGGSQFVDSPGTGRYHTYLCDEIVPFVDAHYRTMAGAAHRGIMGKSSGGFGAMITPMLRPDLFGGLATHAGDGMYECCYIPEFAKAVRFLRDYDGDIFAWWKDFQARTAFTKEGDRRAADDPRRRRVFLRARRWNARAAVRSAAPAGCATRSGRAGWRGTRCAWCRTTRTRCAPLRAVWIDAGTRDDWYLDLAATGFRDELAKIGVTDVQLRAVRCDAHGDRLSLPDVARVPRQAMR